MSADLTGAIQGQRQGSLQTAHTFPVTFSTSGIGSGKLLTVIKASPLNPVGVEVSCQVVTVFNGLFPVLTIGTTATATEWLAAADITETATGYYPASNVPTKFQLTADTSVYAKYTSDASDTTGAAVFIIKEERQFGLPITPHISTATINGTTVTLVFDVAVTGGSGFTGVVQGVSATFAYASGNGTTTLVLTSSVAAVNADVVTLNYTPGNITAGNYPLASVSARAVTNSTP